MAQDFNEQITKIRREAEEREAKRQAEKSGLPYLDLVQSPIQINALQVVPEVEAKNLKIAPFQYRSKVLAMAVYDPKTPGLSELLEQLKKSGNKVKLFASSLSALKYAWTYYKYVTPTGPDISGKIVINKDRFKGLYEKLISLDLVKKEIENFDFNSTPTTNLIEIVMAGALRNRASDIHFEAEEKNARFRFRIDGDLQDVIHDFSNELYPFLVSRIKVLSNLKLNIKDAAQDGRFSIELGDKNIEMRVSIIPSEFGETIVMRILDPSGLKVKLDDLGLRSDDLELIKNELMRPNGMILNTGPTGSGKTTTLYTFLLHKRTPEIKIITIEDPIEYHLEDIEQTQTDPEAGYTFADGLRSMMRQDPDVILVGEIRDRETGEIAVQAALTGHLVFSTVHANSEAGAIPRLLDLGVKPVSIGPALNLVIAQRLVKRLCVECRTADKPSAELKKKIDNIINQLPSRVNRSEYQDIKIFKPKGCKKCNSVGYRGRLAIFGLLRMTKELEAIISPTITVDQIRAEADKQGMVHMQQDGILKVISGITTFEEIESVTGPIVW
jgi:type II secretory ATPase GspE/PulE/Tfp pilus assembly ATPase PilB-like protein